MIVLPLLPTLAAAPAETPVPTTVVRQDGAWRLLRGGTPYFVRGAGGQRHLDLLRASGANSLRTWGADGAGAVLDRAASLDMTVTVGLWLGHKEHGFRYDDPAQVARQQKEALAHVARYRNHPALLFWALGNEMENGFDGDDVWIAVEALAREVKRLDPNHPVLTVVAEIDAAKIAKIRRLCPSLDALGINSYGGAATLPDRLQRFGWDKPYLVTEFGPRGPWESRKTSWNAPVEESSTQKAQTYKTHYEKAVAAAPERCLGSYVFLWDDKAESTATWFGMFLPHTGERLATVDLMAQLWGAKPPANRVPRIDALESDAAEKEIAAGAPLNVRCVARDPENDPLRLRWEIRREDGGLVDDGPAAAAFSPAAPTTPGAYRLFVVARDTAGGAAVANFPFRVRG